MFNLAIRNTLHLTVSRARNILALTFMVVASSAAAAQAGSLDPTFAKNGIFADNFGGFAGPATVVALQSDGKIVAGGDLNGGSSNKTVVLRLTTSGALDSSFGSGGSVEIGFGATEDFIAGMAIQTNGKIVLSGGSQIGAGDLVRLSTDGSFDTAFGHQGFVSVSPMVPGALVLQPDGKIVVLGVVPGNANSPPLPQIERYDSNGQLDTTFGSGGTAALVFAGSAITMLTSGKFLVTSAGFSAGIVARYNNNGGLDTSFGISGQASLLPAPGIAVQTNGRIVTAGSIATGASSVVNPGGFGLVRLNANGTPDATFGSRGGTVSAFPGFQTANAFALLIQSNADIVAAGAATNGSGSTATGSFALARYLTTGQLDTSFGSGGLVTTNFGSGTSASIAALVLQTDGKIVAAGNSSQGNFIVARYLAQ